MKKNILLLITLLCLAISSFAQETVDRVILTDGTVIEGIIMVYKSKEKVQIKTTDNRVLEFSAEEFKAAQFGVKSGAPVVLSEEEPKKENGGKKLHVREPGIYNTITLGFLPTLEDNPYGANIGRTLSYTIGYRIHRLAHVGAGYGGNFYTLDFDGYNFMVFYGNYRANFLDKSFTPFFDLKMGYGSQDFLPFDGYNDNNFELCDQNGCRTVNGGGLLFNPSFGVQLPSGRKTHFDVGVGYLMQETKGAQYNTVTNRYEVDSKFLHAFGLYAHIAF